MTYRKLTSALGVLFALILTSTAVQADTQAVQTTVSAWVRMWNTFDASEVDRLFLQSEELTYFSSEKQGRIQGIEAVREHHRGFGFVAGGISPKTSLWLQDTLISMHNSTASVTALWVFQRSDGSLQKGPVSIVLVSEKGEFKIAHMNFSTYDEAKEPKGIQATSLLGKPLISATPSTSSLENLAVAKRNYEEDADSIDNIIWYGRRIAYTGDYRSAIRVFSEGIVRFPNEARFYRHRGHRYLSVREYEAAIRDFERAWELVQDSEDVTEPDGLPNALNQPRSSLHTNIRYHLALGYYLTNQLEKAATVYQADLDSPLNDDMRVATSHWAYMTLRRLDRFEEAKKTLAAISPEMDVIENFTYQNLCLFYKGVLEEEAVEEKDAEGQTSAGAAYGLAHWKYYSVGQQGGLDAYREILSGTSWSSFGYLAAEADLARSNR